MIRKKCLRPQCGSVYREKDEGFELDCCRICGAIFQILEEEVKEVYSDTFEDKIQDDVKEIEENRESNETEDNYVKANYVKVDTENKVEEAYQPDESNNSNNDYEEEDFFFVDSEGFIHFKNMQEEEYTGDKLIIYKGPYIYKTVPLVYDETIIGRNNSKFNPDVDLSPIDPEKKTSRKHIMVYKNNGKFFVRNISAKASVHINIEPLLQDQNKEIKDGDLIILSRLITIEYVAKDSGEGGAENVEERTI